MNMSYKAGGLIIQVNIVLENDHLGYLRGLIIHVVSHRVAS